MPKLRNGSTDLARFTQWIGRKMRNHNPLQELALTQNQRGKTPNMYSSKTKGDLGIVAGGEDNVLLYEAANRMFEITVREVDPEVYENVKRVKIDY